MGHIKRWNIPEGLNKEWMFCYKGYITELFIRIVIAAKLGVKTARCKRIILLRIGSKTIIKYVVNTALNQGSRKLFLGNDIWSHRSCHLIKCSLL